MSRWRPAPDEERWLQVAARLRGAIARDALTQRAGGWRCTGPFARGALFVLGSLAAVLICGILGFGSHDMLFVSGVIAAGAAEWLKVGKRLHASGIEEGLCLGGFLMVALWIADKTGSPPGGLGPDAFWIALIFATGAAGLRLLNPIMTTGAALAGIEWLDSTQLARSIDAMTGGGMTALVVACAIAALALAAGAREFRRPSHDRMLDWMVVALPAFAYARHATWGWFAAAPGALHDVEGRLATTTLLLALGVVSLAAGLRRRRHGPLLAFLACTACVAVELRRASPWSTETWLVLGGLAAIVAGLVIDRLLRQPRNGVTSAKLTDREGPLDLLQAVGAVILAPSGRSEPSPAGPVPAEHGGRFGGGGASGSY